MTYEERFFASKDGKAPSTIGAPAYTHVTDRSVFKQTPLQKEQAITVKQNHKDILRKHYGKDWRKHMNPPSEK